MTLLVRIALLLACSSLISCASPPTLSGPPFSGIDRPSLGLTRLYVFRPEFSKSLKDEQPTLVIDGQAKALLAVETFATYVLPPGKHVLSLKPQRFESSVWQSDIQITLEANLVYFVAVWNTTEVERSFELLPLGGKAGFLPLPSTSVRSTGVRIELVREDEALPVLTSMHHAVPVAP